MGNDAKHWKSICDFILYYLILPLVSISFVLHKLTNDSRIFIAAEAIADTYYKLPYGWDAAYEVKPIGNRILNWCLYKIANAFVPFVTNNYDAFGFIIRISALILLIVCCWYISRKIVFPYSFPVIFLCFACQANFGILMSEWFSVLFSLVAIALCMEDKTHYTFLSGIVMVFVGLLKSITSLMLIPMICGVYLLNKKFDIKYLILGCITASLTFLALCATIFPYSISDMIMSGMVAHAGAVNIVTVIQWFWLTQLVSSLPIVMLTYIPGIVVGGIASALLILLYVGKSEYKNILLIAIIWFIPCLIVCIESEFFVYHYILLLFPAIISIVIYCRSSKNTLIFLVVAILLVLPGYAAITSNVGSFTAYEQGFWQSKETNADIINSELNLTNQTSMLYLDPGDAAYYFHANSSCHYIAPMPVERNNAEWNMSSLHQYKETRDCILTYQGEYIIADTNKSVLDDYYGESIFKDTAIKSMITKNYTLVENKSWDVYRKNTFLK